jgi:RNA polymerase sigma-70 factor (ECF subfamily)
MPVKNRFPGADYCGEDNEVAFRVAQGDCDLFRVLVERHEAAVSVMGRGFFKSEDDALDFVQEVFIKAFRNIKRFEGRSRFSTWLYRVAYNEALNRVSRRKEYLSLAEMTETAGDNGGIISDSAPEDEAIKKAAIEAVRKAVSELPEKYRVCIDLYFFMDRSYNEIEMITGIPVNTIKSHVYRAKIILREKLKPLSGCV